ncbi:hypothetical protein LAA29_100126 [Leuconostoc carnosum]|nr:hypothetical protein LAA29_100126 [Leuconostoc carnosum]
MLINRLITILILSYMLKIMQVKLFIIKQFFSLKSYCCAVFHQKSQYQ